MHGLHTTSHMLQTTSVVEPSEDPARANRNMRILHVSPTYYPAVRYGGPIRSVHSLAKAQVERGHQVHVFTSNLDGPQNLNVPVTSPVDLDGVKVHYFPVSRLRRLCWCPAMQVALREQISGFDVAHLHSVFQWPTWAAARAAEAAGVPYFVSPRGMLGQTVIRGKSRWVKTAWIRLVEQRTLSRAAAVHVTAEVEHEEIRALGLHLPNVVCVPNGVTWPVHFAPLSAGPFAQIPRPYALFLSRIDWKKGLDRLITAWQWVPHLSLVIAGNDETGYGEKLRKIAAEAKVSDRVHFVGNASDEDKWALYTEAALFVLPSYSENFGNVVAEAMAMGRAVLVTPEVGLAPLVRECGAGVVTDGAPQPLAAAIRALYQDTVGRELMGERGRFTARRRLSWDSVAVRLVAAYAHACDRRRDAARRAAA